MCLVIWDSNIYSFSSGLIPIFVLTMYSRKYISKKKKKKKNPNFSRWLGNTATLLATTKQTHTKKMVHYRKSSISDLIYIEKSILVGWEDDFVCRTLKLGSHHGGDIRCLGRQNLVAPDSSTKVRCHSIPTNCKHSALIFLSIIKKIFFKLSTGNISKETVAGSKAWP